MSYTNAQEQMIVCLFRDIALAWNNGNGELYASYFTEDCDYVTFHGQHLKGREQVALLHNQLFTGLLRDSELVGNISSLRCLSKDIVIVHQTGGVKLSFQKKVPQVRRSVNSNVIVRNDEQWRVALFHNCRIQQQGILQTVIKWLGKIN